MKKALLYFLLVLYLAFVSIDILTASRSLPAPWNIILKLLFVLGCVIWIHLGQRDTCDPVDFDLIRFFLLFMFLTDFILGVPAKLEGLAGQLFFVAGILSAVFGQCVLILRHLRLSLFNRTKSVRGVSLNPSKKAQIGYGSIFLVVAAIILLAGLAVRGINSSPFAALYVVISVTSLTSAFAYLRSTNQRRSRRLAFLGVLLLFISDSFIGWGSAIVNDPSYLNLIVWGTYAPVLLLIGSSILEVKARDEAPISIPGQTLAGSARR
jgi:hypothetical protein